MKKTLTINLNGRVFNIDEDAYELLDNYLRNLRIYFRKDEGFTEIIADFEARIEELFSEYIHSGYQVISIEQVEKVIQQVGKPEDFDDAQTSSETTEKTFEEKKETEAPKYPSGEKKTKKRLHRNVDNKLLGGVFSGIAAYFGWDETPVRIAGLILLIVIMPAYGWGIWLYLILWAIVPPARTAQEKLEMRGEEVSIENIGKVVSGETTNQNKSEDKNFIDNILSFFVTLAKIALVGLGILMGIPIFIILAIILVAAFSVLLTVGTGLLVLPIGFAGAEIGNITFSHPTLALVATILFAGIPLLSIIYCIVAFFAKLKPIPSSIKTTGILVWIVSLFLLIFSGMHISWNENTGKFHRKNWFFGWSNKNKIEGNGIVTEKNFVPPYFETIKLDDNFTDAEVIIEHVSSDTGKIFIRGESNIIDKIRWTTNGNRLKFTVAENTHLHYNEPIIIKISAQNLNGVEIESIGSIKMPNKADLNDFYVTIDGAGYFSADSLFCNSFKGNVEGIGNMHLKGKTSKANFKLEGAGNINARNFESDEVYASVEGIGNIKCDPTTSLDGKVEGIGSISYKSTPSTKNVKVEGLGKIQKIEN